MALSKLDANSFDLTDNYAFTGTTTGATSTQKLFLIKNLDASSSSTLSFVDGASSVDLDNTYKTYLFKWINCHPSNNGPNFDFFASADGGSSYNTTVTSTFWAATHNEAGNSTFFGYDTGNDEAQSTAGPTISGSGYGDDECCSGELWLFNPSNTTFVKHFFSRTSIIHGSYTNESNQTFSAGYFNTTSAINAVKFQFSAGTIDSGRIALYGIK